MPTPATAAKKKAAKTQAAATATVVSKPKKSTAAVKTVNGTPKSVKNAVLSSIVNVGTSPVRAASRGDAVGRKRKEEPVVVKRRRVLSDVEAAQLRYEEAEANVEELDEPTRKQILDFQIDFLIDSGLLLYTDNAVVLAAARASRPEAGERLGDFCDRTFGTRKPDVMFASFKPLSDFRGNTLVSNLQQESAGADVNGIIDRAKSRSDKRLEAVTDNLREKHQRRLDEERAQQAAEKARLTRTLAEYPAHWLSDLAVEFGDQNRRAAGNRPVKDARVIERLFDIARRAEEQGAQNGNGADEPTAPIEFVVGEVIESYNALALHERQQREQDKRRIRELEEQVARLQAANRAAG